MFFMFIGSDLLYHMRSHLAIIKGRMMELISVKDYENHAGTFPSLIAI